jgi:hypothetical protein
VRRKPRRIDEVTAGFYRYRRVKRGPWLPAVVTVEDGMIYVVEADETLQVGISADSYADIIIKATMEGEAFGLSLLRVVWFGDLINEAEYRQMLETLAWARENQPDHPMLHPDDPIRLAEVRVSSVF